MYIHLIDIINNKNIYNTNDCNKNLTVIPSLFLNDGYLNSNLRNSNLTNSNNIKKHNYTFIKSDKDNDCIDDVIYRKMFNGIKSNYYTHNYDNKTTKRSKKKIKERITRKKGKVKKPKINII